MVGISRPKESSKETTPPQRLNRRTEDILRVRDLRVYFHSEEGIAKAVDGIGFSLKEGDVLGIVGESGCGKSVTALSIMGLLRSPPARVESGEILFNGVDLLKLSKAEMREIRGKGISMIFQDPMTSLNPVFRTGEQIAEVFRLRQGFSKKEALEKSIQILGSVGIASPEERVFDYPHQMSGGMRQRVMIAMAIVCRSRLLIADEPTTALDVTVQAQILDLIQRLKQETGMSIILISHNMGLIAENTDQVIVMYAGRIMESASVRDVFANPYHPYTRSLLKSIPIVDCQEKTERLSAIPGVVPNSLALPEGCKFNDRCSSRFEECTKEEPPLLEISEGHSCRCWIYRP